MADEEQQVQSTPEPPTQQQIEDRLGSFDFDGPTPPQEREAQAAEPQEPQEPQEPREPRQEQPQEEPLAPPVDPEIEWNNRRYKMSEVQRSLATYQQRVNEFQRQQQAFQQQTQGFTNYQQQAAEMLQRAVQMVEQYMPRKPDPALAKTDPFTYQEQRVTWEAAVEKLDEARRNQQNFTQNVEAQRRYQFQQYLAHQAQTTLQKMPELRDPVKFAKWADELKSLAVAHGYQVSDLAHVRDNRLIGILNEAIENRRNKAANESLKAKLKAQAAKPAPSVQQPQRRRSSATVQADNMRAALTRLRNNPSSQQAAEDVLSRFD